MAQRVHPITKVNLYEPGREYQVKYDGFGQNDVLADLVHSGRVTVQPTDPKDLGLPGLGRTGLQVPSGMLVDDPEINCIVARPFLDTTQHIGLGHFTPYKGYWVSLPNRGLAGEVQLFQYDGTANQITGAMSNFALPTNPIFALSLYRADPPADHNWNQAAPYTEIHFGICEHDEWALSIPYGGPMCVIRRWEGQWYKAPESEKSVKVPTLEGFSAGQRLILWIALWRGKLVISTDGFAKDIWVYEVPGWEIRVKQGKVAGWHNAGQFMFSFFPIKMPTAVLDSLPVETGYETQSSSGEMILNYRHLPVIDDSGNPLHEAVVTDTTEERTDLTDTQRAWQATLEPYLYHQTAVGIDPETMLPVDFETMVSPQLFSVTMAQYPQVDELEALEYADIAADVKAAAGDHSDRLRGVKYTLSLDNQLGQYANLEEYRRVKMELGWKMSDDSELRAAVLDGYVIAPPPTVLGGGEAQLNVTALDSILRLQDEKCDGRVAIFDNWPVVDVFHWVLDRCGIPRSQQSLEDTGVRLTAGEPEKPLWLPEPGRSWLEFLEEVAQFDYGAAVFFDAQGNFVKGCPHCRQARTASNVTQHDGSAEGACSSEVSWYLYTRPTEIEDPTQPGEILALRKPRLSLSARDYVNYVAVCGVAQDGGPIRSVVYDPASLYDATSDRFVGWRKMEVRALENYTTQAEANRLAQQIFADRSRRPEFIHIVTPLEPQMNIGQVLAVRGGEQVGAEGQLYRIVSLRHRLERTPGRVAITSIKARWLGTEEV